MDPVDVEIAFTVAPTSGMSPLTVPVIDPVVTPCAYTNVGEMKQRASSRTAKQRVMGSLGFEWPQNYGFPVACGACPYIRLWQHHTWDVHLPHGQR